MANYFSSNIQVLTSTAGPISLPLMKRITAIKYFPSSSAGASGANSSAALLSGSGNSTGNQLWFENTQTGHVTDLLSIYDPDGITVSLGGGAMLFIYGTISRGV